MSIVGPGVPDDKPGPLTHTFTVSELDASARYVRVHITRGWYNIGTWFMGNFPLMDDVRTCLMKH